MDPLVSRDESLTSRSETRELRPFDDYPCLDEVALTLDGSGFSTEERIRAEQLDPSAVRPSLLTPELPTNMAAAVGLRKSQLSYLIWLNDSTLKRSVLVESGAIDDWHVGELIIPEETYRQVSWRPGTSVNVAIVLNDELPPRAGVAHHIGHWIAQKSFRIVDRDIQSENFIEYLSEEDFLARNYPAKTQYVVKVITDALLEPAAPGAPAVSVWFSQSVAAIMAAKSSAKSTKLIINTFAVDFYCSVLGEIPNLDFAEGGQVEIPDGCVLATVLSRVATTLKLSPEDLLGLCRADDGLAKVKSFLQQEFDLCALGIESMKGI